MRYQFHRCTASCQRVVKSAKGKKSTMCRYGFPRTVQEKATLNPKEKTLKSWQKGKVHVRLYNLARTYEERFINDYYPKILMLIECNMDIQYKHEQSMVLDRYITTYITKDEKKYSEKLWEECNSNSKSEKCFKIIRIEFILKIGKLVFMKQPISCLGITCTVLTIKYNG